MAVCRWQMAFGTEAQAAETKTTEAQAKVVEETTAETQVVKANVSEAKAAETKGSEAKIAAGGGNADAHDSDEPKGSGGEPGGQAPSEPGLIKTLKQAGLDDRGKVHAPLANEPEKNTGGLDKGKPGLIKILKQAGLDTRGEVQLP